MRRLGFFVILCCLALLLGSNSCYAQSSTGLPSSTGSDSSSGSSSTGSYSSSTGSDSSSTGSYSSSTGSHSSSTGSHSSSTGSHSSSGSVSSSTGVAPSPPSGPTPINFPFAGCSNCMCNLSITSGYAINDRNKPVGIALYTVTEWPTAGNGNWTAYQPRNKTIFYPKIDEFSLLTVFGSANKTWYKEQNLVIQVEVGPIVSAWKFVRRPGLVQPFFTVVVTVDRGVVQSIDFDQSCIDCFKDECIQDNCMVPVTDCAPTGTVDCDLKVYVAWYGSDVNSRFLTSAGMIPSRFRVFSLSSGATNTARSFRESLPSPEEF